MHAKALAISIEGFLEEAWAHQNQNNASMISFTISQSTSTLNANAHHFLRCTTPTLMRNHYMFCVRIHFFLLMVMHVDQVDDEFIFNNTWSLASLHRLLARVNQIAVVPLKQVNNRSFLCGKRQVILDNACFFEPH